MFDVELVFEEIDELCIRFGAEPLGGTGLGLLVTGWFQVVVFLLWSM